MHGARRVIFDELYADWQRAILLRSGIDKVVARLRATRCLSLREEDFEKSLAELLPALVALTA